MRPMPETMIDRRTAALEAASRFSLARAVMLSARMAKRVGDVAAARARVAFAREQVRLGRLSAEVVRLRASRDEWKRKAEALEVGFLGAADRESRLLREATR